MGSLAVWAEPSVRLDWSTFRLKAIANGGMARLQSVVHRSFNDGRNYARVPQGGGLLTPMEALASFVRAASAKAPQLKLYRTVAVE